MTLYKLISRANVSCPPWFSTGARNLIKRILDPNPHTRITIAQILEDEWLKNDYKPPHSEHNEDVSLEDVDAAFDSSEEHLVAERREKPESMNAFALISRSEGFNLGNLFEKEMMGTVKRETSFASQRTPHEIMSKIEEACGPLGFNVRKQNYKMKVKSDKTGRKGHLSVATEVPTLSPDEVYAQVMLMPEPEQSEVTTEKSSSTTGGTTPTRPAVRSFCKTLTASDTSTHGGFSVLRHHADECLPPLDMTQSPPTQELVAKDLHGNMAWSGASATFSVGNLGGISFRAAGASLSVPKGLLLGMPSFFSEERAVSFVLV